MVDLLSYCCAVLTHLQHTLIALLHRMNTKGCRSSRLPIQCATAFLHPLIVWWARLNWQAGGGCQVLVVQGNTGDEQIWMDWILGAADTVGRLWRHPTVLSGIHVTGVLGCAM